MAFLWCKIVACGARWLPAVQDGGLRSKMYACGGRWRNADNMAACSARWRHEEQWKFRVRAATCPLSMIKGINSAQQNIIPIIPAGLRKHLTYQADGIIPHPNPTPPPGIIPEHISFFAYATTCNECQELTVQFSCIFTAYFQLVNFFRLSLTHVV